ncbi:MAG: LamG domain-containing protein [Verrucomicrobia bacterium]|nr:LamG domain-containing protein [Verrucomicrobiota bacterium]
MNVPCLSMRFALAVQCGLLGILPASHAQSVAGADPAPSTNGTLILHYSFDGIAEAVVPDKSGHGNDGALRPYGGALKVGPVLLKGKKGGALRLNGTTDFVECQDHPSIQSPAFTVTLWLKTNGSTSHQYVATKYAWNIMLTARECKPCFETKNLEGPDFHSLVGKRPVSPDEWTFIAAAYDRKQESKELYVDGELSESSSGISMIEAKGHTLLFGKYLSDAQYFSGLIGPVKYYQRSLSEAEIAKQYQTEKELIDEKLAATVPETDSRQPQAGPVESYIGLKTKAVAPAAAKVPDQLSLQNGTIHCEINPKTGAVTKIEYPHRGKTVVAGCEDIYLLEDKQCLESADSATGYRAVDSGKKGFELICKNNELPDITITKRYELENDRLVKTVSFSADSVSKAGKLLFYRSRLRMDPSFYKGGWFYRPMWDGGSGPGTGTVPFYPESAITEPRPIQDLNSAQAIFLQPAWKAGLAHYKFSVNGHYDRTMTAAWQQNIIKDQGTLLPGGWELYLTGDFVRPGPFLTCQSHFMLFDGDAREFHRRHLNLPGFAELAQSKVPDWYRRVKYIFSRQYVPYVRGGGLVVESAKRYVSTLAENELLMTLFTDWCISGDYPSQDKIMSCDGAEWKFETTADEVKRNLAKYRALAPDKIKIGFYTWQGSASDKSAVYMKEHPDWLLRGKDGELIEYGSSEKHNYLKNAVTKEHIDFIAGQYRAMAKFYDLDFTYVDGGHGELVNFQPNRNFVHLYHLVYLYNAIKRAAESAGKLHFSNGSCFPEHSHAGFFELGADHTPFDVADWRTFANLAYLTKCYSPAGGGVICYWNGQGDSNRQMMYGLKMHVGVLAYYQDLSHLFLVSDIALETADSRLVAGDHVHPNWWNFETQTLESAFSKQGNSYLLPLVHHGRNEAREKVTVNLAGLDFKKGQPIYQWRHEVQGHYGLDWTAHTPGLVDTVALGFEVATATQDQLSLDALLKPNRLQMITLSQMPAFVYSVAGKRNNLMLTSNRGAAVTSVRPGKTIRIEAQCDASAAEILALLPEKCNQTVVTVNGKKVEGRILQMGAYHFALFPVAKGRSVAEVQALVSNEGQIAPLVPPRRNAYADRALGFYEAEGAPGIRAADDPAGACWEISGPGLLETQHNRKFVGTDGVAFRLKPGTETDPEGEFAVVVRPYPGKEFIKRIPLDFSGWREFQFTSAQFDEKPDGFNWEDCTQIQFRAPTGVLRLADFRLLPSAPDRKQTAKQTKAAEDQFGEIRFDP